jgi:hypothetical protein
MKHTVVIVRTLVQKAEVRVDGNTTKAEAGADALSPETLQYETQWSDPVEETHRIEDIREG